MRRVRALPAATLAGALALTGCSTLATGTPAGAPPAGDAPPATADYGVTDTTITLGLLTDDDGPLAGLTPALLRGHRLWVKETNSAGGVCDRKIRLAIREDPTPEHFDELEPTVLGLLHLAGAPAESGVDQRLIATETTAAWLDPAAAPAANPYLLVPGATQDVQLVNGVASLIEHGALRDGEPLGVIRVEGQQDDDGGLRGVRHIAAEHHLALRETTVPVGATDLRPVVGGLAGQGARAIVLTTAPEQTGAAALANQQLNLNLPLLGTSAAFDPALLTGPAAPALGALTVATVAAPFGADLPAAQHVARLHEESGTGEPPDAAVTYGYAVGEVWGALLQRACGNDDLTRAGIQEAARQSTALSTDGLLGDLDFSQPGVPSTREGYLAVPDPAVPGGLRPVRPLWAAPDAESFRSGDQGDRPGEN